MFHEVERFAAEHGVSLHGDGPNELRILVVDDDDHLVRYMVELLTLIAVESDINLQVEVAADGFEAGANVFRFRPHVILLDLLMPGMDGFEVCRGLKADPITRPIRVIAMTGLPSEENIERITSAGAETCLNKPIDQEALVVALRLNRQRSARSLLR
jgi:two-component system cell cycle response regulator